MTCSCPVGRREDVADIDAALRAVGQPGAESLNRISFRTGLGKSTLSRHKNDCLGLGGSGGAARPTAQAEATEPRPDPSPEQAGTPRVPVPEHGGTPGGTAGTIPERSRLPRGLKEGRNPKDDDHTSTRKALSAETERLCFDLRLRGRSYAAICEEVGVNYDTAVDAVERVLLRTRRGTDRKAEQLRTLECERIDRLIDAAWDRATDPNRSIGGGEDAGYDPSQDKAIERVTKLIERRAKLLGLDTPTSGPLVVNQINILQSPEVRAFVVGVMSALHEASSKGLSGPDVEEHVVAAMRSKILPEAAGSGPEVIEARTVEGEPASA